MASDDNYAQSADKASLSGSGGSTGELAVASLSRGSRLDAASRRPKLPLRWKVVILVLTCLCSFGNHWSNGLIVALKTTIIKETKINNSQFATLVAVTNLVNTFLCVGLGYAIDRFGGSSMSVILAAFHFSGATIMAGGATNNLNSYPLLIVGKVVAAIGDGSLDNAQHRIFSTYFGPGRGFAFSIGAIWSVANLAQFVGQSTANIIATNLGTYAWALWISAAISLFSLLCAISVFFLHRYLSNHYGIVDHTTGLYVLGARAPQAHGSAAMADEGTDGSETGSEKKPSMGFKLSVIRHFPLSFWIVILFAIFENAGVQSFVSISTQFAQQRLKKGAVIGGWVSSFYLLLPTGLTVLLGIFIDLHGHRVTVLFISGLTFLTAMLLLKFSHTVPAFVAAYVFYALSQTVTPAPQVEIVRSIISEPQHFATAFALKKSVVQASIVIITVAAGKLQDDTPSDSLDNAVTLWLVYAFLSVLISGTLLLISYTDLLPAVRLAQVPPRRLPSEVERLWEAKGLPEDVMPEKSDSGADGIKAKERILKAPNAGSSGLRAVYMWMCLGIIVVGWILFGLGVRWGVHGSVVAGTVGE